MWMLIRCLNKSIHDFSQGASSTDLPVVSKASLRPYLVKLLGEGSIPSQ